MPNKPVRWCETHGSVAIMPKDDKDTYYLCEKSNRTADKTPCKIVKAKITWR